MKRQASILRPATSSNSVKHGLRLLSAALCSVGLAACSSIGPDYVRPQLDLPQQWKQQAGADQAQWQAAQPSDTLPRGTWWTLLGDDGLNQLQAQALQSSFSLQLAVARLQQTLAQSDARAAALLPSVQANASATRTRTSAERPLASYNAPVFSTTQNDFRPVLSASYELDWLGRVRRDVEAARATADQARAEQENARLILSAQIASSYMQLRQLDEEIAALRDSVGLQERVLGLITKRYEKGASGQSDLAQQTALTNASRAQLELLLAQRNQQENALATLSGIPAAQFKLAPARLPAALPPVPLGLPAQLLQRRPDIAAAERAVAAANASVGVAQAAFFPSLTLAPTFGGLESRTLSNLVSTPALVWSLGLSASQTLFDGGRLAANEAFARASYTAAVASYRQSVLVAIQEVQDALGNLQQLDIALQRQREAVRNQERAFNIGLRRYQEGLDNAITLATLQQNLLQAQRVQSQLTGNRFLALVALVKALGGGWDGAVPQAASAHATPVPVPPPASAS